MVTGVQSTFPQQRGTSLIEVLVTLVILSIGLLGLAGLQSRLQVSELEAYQRAQALILLDDMASRITTNRSAAASYVTASPLGGTTTCPTTTSTQQQTDSGQWCSALQGAAETTGGSKVGAMIGGRGCVQSLGSNQYLVTVAWQGLTPIAAPAPTCGQNSYNTAGTACVNDLCRRVVTTIVRIGTLS
jgi:type IV pilus assembly protein PilV